MLEFLGTCDTRDDLISLLESENGETFFEELKKASMAKGEKGGVRKGQVLELLKERGKVSILDMAEALGVSSKNISSILSYLRKDGVRIGTTSDGKKFIEED